MEFESSRTSVDREEGAGGFQAQRNRAHDHQKLSWYENPNDLSALSFRYFETEPPKNEGSRDRFALNVCSQFWKYPKIDLGGSDIIASHCVKAMACNIHASRFDL
jgi:hypothetical protein